MISCAAAGSGEASKRVAAREENIVVNMIEGKGGERGKKMRGRPEGILSGTWGDFDLGYKRDGKLRTSWPLAQLRQAVSVELALAVGR